MVARDPGRPDSGAEEEGTSSLETLTDREREIMVLVARGLTNDEIARRLLISPATVKTHVDRVLKKLGAGHRARLVTIAYETGLVSPN